jgi:hypothetical protein
VNPSPQPHPLRFWIFAGAGFAVMGFGAMQYLDATPDWARRLDFAKFLVGADILHDFVVAPLVCAVGLGVARFVPARVRAPIQFACMASGVVLLLALPGLRQTAALTNNPSIQPINYATATLTVLAAVWVVALVWIGVRLYRFDHSRRRSTSISR